MSNRLQELAAAGQAAWLDFVDRHFLETGGLKTLIDEDGLTGVTSNPSIFEKAMGQGTNYDAGLKTAMQAGDKGVWTTYEGQAVLDIKAAAKDLRPTYDRLEGRDGYVSLEVSPYLANDTRATLNEARRLWAEVGEPNVMIKVPGTNAGAPAIRQLISEGININVTLLFSPTVYQAVAWAYIEGLEARVAKGEPIDKLASVASFFVSRIDSKVDGEIDARIARGDPQAEALKAVRGKVAIANAKVAYARYLEIIATDRWRALAAEGAQVQRLLWASTSTKDPSFPDTIYVDELIGPDTVNTMPQKTVDAFRDHGTVAPRLTQGADAAQATLEDARKLGFDIEDVASALVEDGVRQFADAADALASAVAAKRTSFLGDKLNPMTETLPEPLATAVKTRLDSMRASAWTRRLYAGDNTLWTGKDEQKWLAWIPAARGERVDPKGLAAVRTLGAGLKDVVLLGMGGSSLGPEVLGEILGASLTGPKLHALDTTDPGQIATLLDSIDPKTTLFIVSSKSGSTMEPELLRSYFWDLAGKDGDRFVAVTDPGSHLQATAMADGYKVIAMGDPGIGGRYSVLSPFGMVPAAAIGIDVEGLYAATKPMVSSCGPDAPPAVNPGLRLGAIIGEAALVGRDKLTILPSKGLEPFGAWLEQLLAESTGKQGKGVVPVDLEPMGAPAAYDHDRLFVHLHMKGDADDALEAGLKRLSEAGHPLVTITVADPMQLGQEFFRWEVATAIVGAILGLDAFDQPDVEAAKIATRKLVDAYETGEAVPPETVAAEDADFQVFTPDGAGGKDAKGLVAGLFDGIEAGDYVGVLAYVERDAAHTELIRQLRAKVRDAFRVATVSGFGPRFLHSTGQAYKGGPAGGHFLVVTREPERDATPPGHKASFGTVQVAQAIGDMQVLAERGRKVIRVHLKKGGGGLHALASAVEAALPTMRS